MKTRCSVWAPSGIHRGSIMQSRTRMRAEMPTLTSRAAITCTIKRCRAGTSQQVLAHQTSSALTGLYPTFWDKMMSALSNLLPGKEIVRTVADRRAAGRSLRKEVPRSSHAEWSPASDRPDPISLLEEQNLSRQAQLVPIRYGRMATSPLILLRSAVTWGEAIDSSALLLPSRSRMPTKPGKITPLLLPQSRRAESLLKREAQG